MTRDELNALIQRRAINDAGGPGPSVHAFPVSSAHLHGTVVATVPPNLGAGAPIQHVWIVIIDDRAPFVSGPDSFDRQIMTDLLRSASLVAIDSAEPGADIYSYFMDEVASGKRLLVIQTTEARHEMWREFLRVRWHGSQIAEVVPVKGDPARTLRAFITYFDRHS